MIEVDPDQQQPSEGEVLVVTSAGGFIVQGTVAQVAQRLSAEPWPTFTLAESGDTVMVNSGQVVALRAGTGRKRSTIGFHPR